MIFKTKSEARAFLKRIHSARKVLEGKEREQMLLIFEFIEPIKSSNNQHSWTDTYEYAGKVYYVHNGIQNEPIIEVIEDDIQPN